MKNDFLQESILLKLVSKIGSLRPEFGTINLELSFHQKKLTRVKILDRINQVILESGDSKNG